VFSQAEEEVSVTFSIIVPVYNATTYLQGCIDSVLRQTYQDFEVILVDDGSTDASPQLCDTIAQASKGRVRVIHQPNQGTSAARNTGVKSAQGEYLLFMDNDDFLIEDTALFALAARIKEDGSDLVLYSSRIFDERTGVLAPRKDSDDTEQLINGRDKASALRTVIAQGLITRAVWVKATRRDLVERDGITFPVGMRNEDTDWSASVLEAAQSISWCSGAHYAYRKGSDYAQTSKPIDKRQVQELARIIDQHVATVSSSSASQDEKRALYAYLAYPLMVWCGQSAALGIDGPGTDTYTRMSACARLLMPASCDPAVTLAARTYRLLGMRLTRFLLGKAFLHRYPGAIKR
jgi:GT2 family glycosyltransferase